MPCWLSGPRGTSPTRSFKYRPKLESVSKCGVHTELVLSGANHMMMRKIKHLFATILKPVSGCPHSPAVAASQAHVDTSQCVVRVWSDRCGSTQSD